jgi:hypothetical protein
MQRDNAVHLAFICFAFSVSVFANCCAIQAQQCVPQIIGGDIGELQRKFNLNLRCT